MKTFLCLVILFSATVRADDDTDETVVQRVQELEERVGELEHERRIDRINEDWPGDAERAAAARRAQAELDEFCRTSGCGPEESK